MRNPFRRQDKEPEAAGGLLEEPREHPALEKVHAIDGWRIFTTPLGEFDESRVFLKYDGELSVYEKVVFSEAEINVTCSTLSTLIAKFPPAQWDVKGND